MVSAPACKRHATTDWQVRYLRTGMPEIDRELYYTLKSLRPGYRNADTGFEWIGSHPGFVGADKCVPPASTAASIRSRLVMGTAFVSKTMSSIVRSIVARSGGANALPSMFIGLSSLDHHDKEDSAFVPAANPTHPPTVDMIAD
jgi:hypothetical protein